MDEDTKKAGAEDVLRSLQEVLNRQPPELLQQSMQALAKKLGLDPAELEARVAAKAAQPLDERNRAFFGTIATLLGGGTLEEERLLQGLPIWLMQLRVVMTHFGIDQLVLDDDGYGVWLPGIAHGLQCESPEDVAICIRTKGQGAETSEEPEVSPP